MMVLATVLHVCPANAVSAYASAQTDQCPRCPLEDAYYNKVLREESDQTVWTHSLICVFADSTCSCVGNATCLYIFALSSSLK